MPKASIPAVVDMLSVVAPVVALQPPWSSGFETTQ